MSNPTTSSLPPPETFTLFPELPIEIRWKIWRMTLQPRVVEVIVKASNGIYSTATLPIAFEVNKDSRKAVMVEYKLSFGSESHPAITYLNYSLDTVFLDLCWFCEVVNISRFFDILTDAEKAGIKHLVLDDDFQHFEWVDENEAGFEVTQKGVESITGLQQLGLCFEVDYIVDGCTWEHSAPQAGTMRLFDTFPAGIENAETGITVDHERTDDILKRIEHGRYTAWEVRKVEWVFGWRNGYKPIPYSAEKRAAIARSGLSWMFYSHRS